MSGNIRARRIEPMRTRDDLNSYTVKNASSSVRIQKYDTLRCGRQVDSSGTFFQATLALAATSGAATGFILIADSDILPDGYGIARRMYVIPFNTLGAALGDGVYLSAITLGALTLVATTERVGWVSYVGTSGYVTVYAEALNAQAGAPFAHALTDHSDVSVPTPADGEVLTWNAGAGSWLAADIYDLLDFNRLVILTAAFAYDVPNDWSEVALPSALAVNAGVIGSVRLYVNGVSDLAFVASGTPLAGEWGISGTELRIGGDITGGADTYKVIWPS